MNTILIFFILRYIRIKDFLCKAIQIDEQKFNFTFPIDIHFKYENQLLISSRKNSKTESVGREVLKTVSMTLSLPIRRKKTGKLFST